MNWIVRWLERAILAGGLPVLLAQSHDVTLTPKSPAARYDCR